MSPPPDAVLLAAGMGTRFGDRTRRRPKPLLPVNGISIVKNAVTCLAAAGIARTTVVIGHYGEQITSSLGDAAGPMALRYAANEHYASTGTARSLWLGLRDTDNDVLVLEGDVFFERSTLEHFLDAPYSDATLVEHWHPPLDGSVVEVGDDQFVERWVHQSERPAGFSLAGTHKTVNLHRFSARFIRDRLRPALGNGSVPSTEPIELPLARVVADGARIRAVAARGRWVEIDDEDDLRDAESLFSGATDGSR